MLGPYSSGEKELLSVGVQRSGQFVNYFYLINRLAQEWQKVTVNLLGIFSNLLFIFLSINKTKQLF